MIQFTVEQLREKDNVVALANYLGGMLDIAVENIDDIEARMLATRMSTCFNVERALVLDGKAGPVPWQYCQSVFNQYTNVLSNDFEFTRNVDKMCVAVVVNICTSYSLFLLQFAPGETMQWVDDEGEPLKELPKNTYDEALGKLIAIVDVAERNGVRPPS